MLAVAESKRGYRAPAEKREPVATFLSPKFVQEFERLLHHHKLPFVA